MTLNKYEKNSISENNEHTLECSYCHMPFQSEKRFLKHQCKTMKRVEEMQTLKGKSAYMYYSDWFKHKNLRIPDQDAFITSKFFNTFMVFSEFVKRMGITDVDLYIKFMIARQYQPSLWMNNEPFKEFLQFTSKNLSPNDHCEITVKWLDKYAGFKGCSIKEIIDKLDSYEIMDGIRQRKFLPWYIFHSPKFSSKIKNLSKDQLKELHSIIDFVFWDHELNSQPEIRKEIRKLTKQIET